ncbi:MAG TPA: glutaredoxin family protein [Polyangium sp.]|nr:glutaredoxin family protein [Polyangium sp.]
MKTVTFYTRENCCLCDVALEIVERVRTRVPFELVIVDLDHEAAIEKKTAYDWDIPVLEIDGRKMMKHRVDEARLLRLLETEASTSPRL